MTLVIYSWQQGWIEVRNQRRANMLFKRRFALGQATIDLAVSDEVVSAKGKGIVLAIGSIRGRDGEVTIAQLAEAEKAIREMREHMETQAAAKV